jgi:4-amino-4-deoxychorismate lyase
VHPIIYLNKTMVEAAKARIAPVSAAMLYGRGVFTTVAIYNSHAFLWPEHWARLTDHAARLNISCVELDEATAGQALTKLISVNQVKDGRARVILLGRSSQQVWRADPPGPRKTDLVIMTGDSQRVAERGISLAVSPYRSNSFSPLVGIKSLNYLEHVLSWEEAHARDFDEAVVLNERGEIVSATMANIFWVKDGTVHTPALSTGAMAGITRGCVIALAQQHFIPLLEGIYEVHDLTSAQEIFLTSANLGLSPISTFDFRTYAMAENSIAKLLRDALRDRIGLSNLTS